MRISFRKMQGLGNDFLVIDARDEAVTLSPSQIRALADRRTGVGFDQLLILEPAGDATVQAAYRVFNADGSEAEQCGNGVRCLARLVASSTASAGSEFVLQGPATRVIARIRPDGLVTVGMGQPDFDPRSLPFEADAQSDRYALDLGSQMLEIGAVSMGNPHAVLGCPDVSSTPVSFLGAEISRHPRFPRETNVEFMEIVDRQHITLRVYERGVGETRACGSGACAAAAIGQHWGSLDATVEVALPGGELTVEWPGPGHTLWLTGPAEDVFGGYIDL